ncbi:MAG TPA: hypothetical protein VLA36_17190 [Longimicrobiales bacterium]|nr:hypothetical protein [Longimicrobiales bacterium]
MNRSVPFLLQATRAVVAVTLLAGCSDLSEPSGPGPDPTPRMDSYWGVHSGNQPFTLYTQNVYLGGDTGPIFSLDFNDIPAVLQATKVFWDQVQQSNVAERAAALVDELDARRPHVVGLQEVFRFAVVDARTGAVVGGADILAVLEAEIAARGLPYEVVRVQENTSVVLPLSIDLGTMSVTEVLSATDRVVALRRTDVTLTASAQGTYAARFSLGPVTLTRGWIRMSVDFDGIPYHVVTTHLETQGLAPVQAGQAQELLNGVVAGLDGVTVVSGDLNSDAAAGPGTPSWTPTYDLFRDAGFADAWLDSGHDARDPGFTCCQDPDLMNAFSLLDERIDHVLIRTSPDPSRSGRVPGSVKVEIVGEESNDRTPSGLWRADHAGLVAGLRLPAGLITPAGH